MTSSQGIQRRVWLGFPEKGDKNERLEATGRSKEGGRMDQSTPGKLLMIFWV